MRFVMHTNPTVTLRNALEQLLENASFQYDGQTRKLVRACQEALRKTTLPVAHERPVGIFRYDPAAGDYIPVPEAQALNRQGELREGYEYLFRSPDVATSKRH